MSSSEVRMNFSQVVHDVAHKNKRIIIRRGRQDVAGLVRASDVQLLAELDRQFNLKKAYQELIEKESGGDTEYQRLKARLLELEQTGLET